MRVLSARASIANAVLQDGNNSPVNIDKVISARIFTPSITIDKVGSKTGPLPAPQDVIYTFYVRNGSDPSLPLATTALSNVKVTDDKCGNPTYSRGDTDGSGKLETNETWEFTCTLTHPAPGTYHNVAVANGDNILSAAPSRSSARLTTGPWSRRRAGRAAAGRGQAGRRQQGAVHALARQQHDGARRAAEHDPRARPQRRRRLERDDDAARAARR